MKYQVTMSSKFKRDYKLILKRGYQEELLREVVAILANGNPLPDKYKDHPLVGNYKGCRECHITPDWLLIYRIEEKLLVLALTRTGTHRDVF